jgi:hypothetical protein
MGTDIYLKWDNMSKKDHDDQITGWRIDKGNTGYIRASIGMIQENELLRKVFPEEVWKPNNPKCATCDGGGLSEDFDKKRKWDDERNWCSACKGTCVKDGLEGLRFKFNDDFMKKFSIWSRLYLGHAIMGTPIESLNSEEQQRANGMMNTVLKAIGGGMTNIDTGEVNDGDIFWKAEFITNIFQFCRLGYEKEKEGLNPRVHISW